MGGGREPLVGIGEFSQLTGLSIDALRYYHRVGILAPTRIDPENGYRRYAVSQAHAARRISELRAVDVPLDTIRTLIEADSRAAAHAVLASHRRELVMRARAVTEMIDAIDRLIEREVAMTAVSEELRAALVAMFDEQQELGQAIFERSRASRPDRFVFELPEHERPRGWEDAARLSHDHAVRLDAIVSAHGWPGASLVGDDGAGAAWAVAQHADEDNDLCQRWLPLLARAVEDGEAPGFHLAALTDRVLLRDRLPQRYGTVIEPDGASWLMRPPIEDPDQVDARRQTLGLPTIADWVASLPSPERWYTGEATA